MVFVQLACFLQETGSMFHLHIYQQRWFHCGLLQWGSKKKYSKIIISGTQCGSPRHCWREKMPNMPIGWRRDVIEKKKEWGKLKRESSIESRSTKTIICCNYEHTSSVNNHLSKKKVTSSKLSISTQFFFESQCMQLLKEQQSSYKRVALSVERKKHRRKNSRCNG